MTTAITITNVVHIIKGYGASITNRTVANWCHTHNIGKIYGRVWIVDAEKLQALLDSDLSGKAWSKLHVAQRAMIAIRANGGTASLV